MAATCTDVVQVPLNNGNGGFALVDAEDWTRVSEHNWTRYSRKRSTGELVHYACTLIDGRSVRLHSFVANTPKGYDTDHWNGDGLDNRRFNLRVCTRSQNLANQIKTRGASRFKGVSRHHTGRWMAEIQRQGVRHRSLHLTEEAAAMAYDAHARELFGEFARCNFPAETSL